MNNVKKNTGLITYGGSTNLTGSAIGEGARVTIHPGPQHTRTAPEPRSIWNIGVVTTLANEARAVLQEFGLKQDTAKTRAQWFYTGSVTVPGATVNVVATRASGPGQRATMTALGNLQRHYDPPVLILVGIGGAIHHSIALDDVVVATRVIYYDLRKVTPQGVRHRGEERESPAWMTQAVNSFFTEHGDPVELHTETAEQAVPFRVFCGPIGSGDAVIADDKNEIRTYLSFYSDKILAVDMEAGGLSQFCHETSSTSGVSPGWVVIRGISDYADSAKDDNRHNSAATNAARTLRHMIPYVYTGA